MREGYHTAAQPGANKAQLTQREREVAALLGQGLPQTKIAQVLGIEYTTIQAHVGNIRVKTGATSARHLALMAAKGEL